MFSVYLDRNINDRIGCGVDEKRCKRDSDRTEIPLKEYDYIIHNNYSLEEFEEKIKQLTIDLLK